jgi:hypothetical protein
MKAKKSCKSCKSCQNRYFYTGRRVMSARIRSRGIICITKYYITLAGDLQHGTFASGMVYVN